MLDPGPSLGSGRARPLLLPHDGPLAIWRQGSCVTPVCHLNLFLTSAGSVSSRSNSSVFSKLQLESPWSSKLILRCGFTVVRA